MKKYIIFALMVLLASCATRSNITYFEGAELNTPQPISQNYDHKIQKDDLLTIDISSQSPDLVLPFTQQGTTTTSLGEESKTGGAKSEPKAYLVNSTGEIIFPILGAIHAEGLTHKELSTEIENRLKSGGYILDPTVAVELKNFKVTVLGAVNSPGVKSIDSNRVTLFDALSMANDMTIYGVRDSVALVRENSGQRVVTMVNINDREVLNSPYYYLQPNDMIYVEPNKKAKKMSDSNPVVLSAILSSTSVVLSVLNLIF